MPELEIVIKANDQASSQLKKVSGEVEKVGTTAKSTSSALSAMTVALGTVMGSAITGGISKMLQLGTSIVQTGIDFNNLKQQANIAFTTMLGSGEKAKSFLDDLQQFAAKTPFEFPDLLQASQRMLAMGFAAEDIKPTLTAIGDAVAGLGGGAAEIDRVTTALGQMNAKGKTSAGEMMQLTEAGIPAWDMLAQKIGVSVPEAMDMVSKGAIDAKTTIGAVVDGMESRFGGMMEKQSSTFGGLLSTLQDTFTQVSGTVMAPFFDMITGGLAKIVEWTSRPEFAAGVQAFADAIASQAQAIADGIQGLRDKWDEDWGGIRTTWEDFSKELPDEQRAFWIEWNKTFNEGSDQNKVGWEAFFGAIFASSTDFWGFALAQYTEALKVMQGISQASHALMTLDWSKFWDGVKLVIFSATDIILNDIEYVFGPGLRDAFARALNSVWDILTGWWATVSEWWNNTVGALFPSMAFTGSAPNLAIVNPLNVPPANSGGSGGFGSGSTNNNMGGVTINQTFNGQTDSDTVYRASQDGVLQAARGLGMR